MEFRFRKVVSFAAATSLLFPIGKHKSNYQSDQLESRGKSRQPHSNKRGVAMQLRMAEGRIDLGSVKESKPRSWICTERNSMYI